MNLRPAGILKKAGDAQWRLVMLVGRHRYRCKSTSLASMIG